LKSENAILGSQNPSAIPEGAIADSARLAQSQIDQLMPFIASNNASNPAALALAKSLLKTVNEMKEASARIVDPTTGDRMNEMVDDVANLLKNSVIPGMKGLLTPQKTIDGLRAMQEKLQAVQDVCYKATMNPANSVMNAYALIQSAKEVADLIAELCGAVRVDEAIQEKSRSNFDGANSGNIVQDHLIPPFVTSNNSPNQGKNTLTDRKFDSIETGATRLLSKTNSMAVPKNKQAAELETRVVNNTVTIGEGMKNLARSAKQQNSAELISSGKSIYAAVLQHCQQLREVAKSCKDARLQDKLFKEAQYLETMGVQLKILCAVRASAPSNDNADHLVSITNSIERVMEESLATVNTVVTLLV